MFHVGWIAARVAFAVVLAAAAASGQGVITCPTYNCDRDYQCTWAVFPQHLPRNESLDDHLRVGRAQAQLRGACDARLIGTPLVLQGVAMSLSNPLTLTKVSKHESIGDWEVRHIKTCKACKVTEGRGRSTADVGFVAKAEYHAPGPADAIGDVAAKVRASEPTTGCDIEAVGEVRAAKSGSISVGATLSGMPGGGAGLVQNFGNADKVEQLFSDSVRTKDVEQNRYWVTMAAALTKSLLQVDGTLFFAGQALIAIEPSAFQLTLYLSCDNCQHPASRVIEIFPR